MIPATLILAARLAVAAVLYVARPFLREPERSDDALPEPDAAELERLRLLGGRDRALAAPKGLNFHPRPAARPARRPRRPASGGGGGGRPPTSRPRRGRSARTLTPSSRRSRRQSA